MKTEEEGCFIVAAVLAAILLGLSFGYVGGSTNIKSQAVDNGCASYTVNEKTGDVQFVWKEQK